MSARAFKRVVLNFAASYGVSLAIQFAIVLSHNSYFTRMRLRKFGFSQVWRRTEVPLFFISQFALLFTAILLVHTQVAALDPINKNLLYEFIRERNLPAVSTKGSEVTNPDYSRSAPTDFRAKLKYLLDVVTSRTSLALASRIRISCRGSTQNFTIKIIVD